MAEKGTGGLDLKLVILMVALVLLTSAASGYVTFLVFRSPAVGSAPVAAMEPGRSELEKGPEEPGPTFDVGQFTVNLAVSPEESVHYLRTQVVVEVDSDKALGELELRKHQVKDRVITIFRSKHVDELADARGTDATRGQITASLNELIGKGRIVDVYFTDFVIQ